MAAISDKYKNIFVGRILKKVHDGQEVKGLVQHLDLIRYNSNAPKDKKLQRTFKVVWDGEEEPQILSQDEVQKVATNEFTTESWMVPEILERQKVGWDESKLDKEDLRLKTVYSQAMSTHNVFKKAALDAAQIVAALEGRKYRKPDPPLQITYGQPVDRSEVFLVAPPHKYKAIKKLKDNVATRKGEAPNNICIKGPYDNALDAGLKPPPLTPEVREEAIRLVATRVAFAETLKQAKEKVRKRRELLARALREEAAEEAEETAEGSEEEPRPAKPVVQKLVPDKIQKQLEAAEAAVEQAKVDAEVAAKAAREFEEKHGLIASKLAAGLKSSKKAAAQPSRANKPKDPAAAKGKGHLDFANNKKVPFGQGFSRAAPKQETPRERRARQLEEKAKRKAAMAAGAGAEAADADAPGPSACPSRRASPAKAPKPARAAAPAAAAASKSAEKRPRAGAATGKTAKQAAATAQQTAEEEVRESSPASSIQLDLSGVNDSGAAAFDEVVILDSSSNGAPSEADAAPEHSGLQPDDDVAMGEADEDEHAVDKEAIRDYPDGRSFPAWLCKRPGDMPMEEWSEKEAKNELPTDTDYEVEAILDERTKRGKREFVVKWKGFELHPFQWFPFENFKDCTEVLEEWEARKPKGNSPGKKRKRARQN